MFQREWYRLQGEGKLSEVDMGTVPDIYLRNQQLGDELRNMSAEMQRQQEVANKAKSTWDKFRKERDFHKMHHKRVVQEKNKLIVDLKRLKNHYSNFEPMLQMMRAKYETAMKEKMLMKLERDRLSSRVAALDAVSELPKKDRVVQAPQLRLEAPPQRLWFRRSIHTIRKPELAPITIVHCSLKITMSII